MTNSRSQSSQIDSDLQPFIDEFISDRLTELNSLKSTTEPNKTNDIKSLTHKWKSFFEPYGFGEIMPEVLQLENASLNSDSELYDKLLGDIENFFLNLPK